MFTETSRHRNTVIISVSTIFGALSAVLAMLPLSFPFPLVPYLKFDIAEMPVYVAFLSFGPIPGFTSALTYWFVLNMFGEWAPIGPLMKFIAVASTLSGFMLGSRILSKKFSMYLQVFFYGVLVRVLATSIANYVLLAFIMPFFFEYASKVVSTALGISLGTGFNAWFLILFLTAVFNILHVIYIMIPSLIVIKSFSRQGLFIGLKEPWIIALSKKKT
ncbi:MAG: hypothetical protein L4877_01735 [Aigarchaeota archaeon]|nr:hypothetical protein [Candidatus Geocrenenecus dongiae]